MLQDIFTCHGCGKEISPNAKTCRYCGADNSPERADHTWKTDSSSAAGIPDPDDFDYDAFLEEEFGTPRKKSHKELFWWLVALLLLIAFAFSIIYY